MASPVPPPRPPVPPASSVAPTSGGDSSITVQPGDSLWKLSRRFLGRGSHWQDWLSDNPGLLDPQSIQAGTILVVPRPTSSAVSPTLGKVLVHPGDSLWKIALAHYGDGAEWQCIAGANPALSDPGKIYPGQTLVLPARCSSETSKPSR
jgi:nucleoid-associated protein YgaU